MHSKSDKQSGNYVKIEDERPSSKASPILLHLAKTGLSVDHLAEAAGFSKVRLIKLLRNAETPDPFECYMLDMAFKFPKGTVLEDYTVWEFGTYQIA